MHDPSNVASYGKMWERRDLEELLSFGFLYDRQKWEIEKGFSQNPPKSPIPKVAILALTLVW